MLVWRFLNASGEDVGRSRAFVERESAEAWMGENWEDLVQRGVEAVVLADEEDGDALYRMALGEA